MFQYTLRNEDGIQYILFTTSFFMPGENITHMGQTCLVQDIEVYNGVSCEELAENSCNYISY